MTKQKFVVKADGTKEVFDGNKLEQSLQHSKASPHVVRLIVEHIEKEIGEETKTVDIFEHASALLRKFERPTAFRYSLKRAIMDLGPTGFPFEDFVAEIFKARGYTTLTDQRVLGNCVEHEVDVVAYNDDKLIMTEVKFHNEPGLRSDLKVALYVKARFDDLSDKEFEGYGKKRTLTEGWLVTNTKFTSTAIHYGLCKGIHMIGWNYPDKDNLQTLVEQYALHPITCLRSLTQTQMRQIVAENVVLCKTLAERTDLMKSIGLTDDEIHAVVEEINIL